MAMKKYKRKKGVASIEAVKNTGTHASRRKALEKIADSCDYASFDYFEGRPMQIKWASGGHNGRIRWADGNYLLLMPDAEIDSGFRPEQMSEADFLDQYEEEAP